MINKIQFKLKTLSFRKRCISEDYFPQINVKFRQQIQQLIIMRREQGYDYLVKLLIIGNSGVGKTNLLLRFCQNNFLTSHLSTIGIDFKTKMLNLGGSRVKLQVWDTAGQQRFKTITQTYYRGAMGIILTYAVDDRNSFNDIQNWVKQIKTHASSDVVKILVGNKCDSNKREVSLEEGKKLAYELGIGFYETSAKEDKNVTEMFLDIGGEAKRILEQDKKDLGKASQLGKGSELGTTRNLITQGSAKAQKKRKCC